MEELKSKRVAMPDKEKIEIVWLEGKPWIIWRSILGNSKTGGFPLNTSLPTMLDCFSPEFKEENARKERVNGTRECWLLTYEGLNGILEKRNDLDCVPEFMKNLKQLMLELMAGAEKECDTVSGPSSVETEEPLNDSPQDIDNSEVEAEEVAGDVVDAEFDPIVQMVREEFASLSKGMQEWSTGVVGAIASRLDKFEDEMGLGGGAGVSEPPESFMVIVEDETGQKIYAQKVENLDLVKMILFVNNLQMNTNAPPSSE